jgi:hypothetical protein
MVVANGKKGDTTRLGQSVQNSGIVLERVNPFPLKAGTRVGKVIGLGRDMLKGDGG